MAVLIEAICVVTRRSAIDGKYAGGWSSFVSDVPNGTLCYDDDLARVAFMTPQNVQGFIGHLEENGLIFLADSKAHDIAVVDQHRGVTTTCEWLEFARLRFGDEGGKVAACWLFEGPRISAGIHLPHGSFTLSTPTDWIFEGSMSQQSIFIPNKDIDGRLTFLRIQDGVDVFFDRVTGKEVFIGQPEKPLARD